MLLHESNIFPDESIFQPDFQVSIYFIFNFVSSSELLMLNLLFLVIFNSHNNLFIIILSTILPLFNRKMNGQILSFYPCHIAVCSIFTRSIWI